MPNLLALGVLALILLGPQTAAAAAAAAQKEDAAQAAAAAGVKLDVVSMCSGVRFGASVFESQSCKRLPKRGSLFCWRLLSRRKRRWEKGRGRDGDDAVVNLLLLTVDVLDVPA